MKNLIGVIVLFKNIVYVTGFLQGVALRISFLQGMLNPSKGGVILSIVASIVYNLFTKT